MNNTNSRRNFFKKIGLGGSALLVSNAANAMLVNDNEILKLNAPQQAFMLQYNNWMNEFIEVIKIQKTEPLNLNNNLKLMQLSEQAKTWQPTLTEYMTDPTFALIYKAMTERMTATIG